VATLQSSVQRLLFAGGLSFLITIAWAVSVGPLNARALADNSGSTGSNCTITNSNGSETNGSYAQVCAPAGWQRPGSQRPWSRVGVIKIQ
jgi:hypothetical protein